nr:reverse transcriptase domain-containing protein [Tanacetum cinerariifolium]
LGDLLVPDLRTMKEICQPSLNGQGSPIALIAIQATNFGQKNDMIQQVQNSCQFHRLSGDDANKHLDRFLHVTQSIKVNGVTDDSLHLYLFPHSLLHHATTWFDRLPRNSINTFEQMAKIYLLNGLTLSHRDTINAAAGGTFMKRHLEECYDLIENMTAHHNDWYTSAQRTTVGNTQNVYAVGAYQGKSYQSQGNYNLLCYRSDNYLGPPGFNQNQNRNNLNHNFQNQNRNKETIILRGTTKEETNSFRELTKANDAILKNMQTNMTSLTNLNLELKNMFGQFMKMNIASSSGSGTLPGNIITNPKEDLKGITTRSGTAYKGPTIPMTTSSSLVVECETEVTKDTVHPTNTGSTDDIQPLVVQSESLILDSEPNISLIIEPVASPVSAPGPNQRPSIPYPSRLQDQKLRDKANDQHEKIFQIFNDLNFNISLADALILMPKFSPSIKSLLTNKDKLCELARNPLNEHCLAVLLKKLPKKLGDPGKFLIPCDFLGMAECLALADLGASINLMPLFVCNKILLPDLSPTCMTLALANRSISHPVRVAEDVFVKVGTFHFSADFVVIDFDADPRVPLILGKSFLKTVRALIDVFKGELTLHIGKEKVLGFSDVIASGNPSPCYDPIISTDSSTLTPCGNSNFLLEEVDTFLAIEDDPTLPKVDQSYRYTEGDILLLEAFLNDDPSLPLSNQ